MKTSINIKKFWIADISSDGDVGTDWHEIQIGQREATVQFQGSDADKEDYKNVLGSVLESSFVKGAKTMNFALADLEPSEVALLAGGTVTTDSESIEYAAPENENTGVEKSVKFLSDKNVLFILPRVSFDAYPVINDDDLHYYQNNGSLLLPEKAGVSIYYMHKLLTPSANDITSFDILVGGSSVLTGAATINATAHTVTAEVVNGTGLTSLAPTIGVSLGASIDPESGESGNFTSAVNYTVEAADGTTQVWAVTVTEAA